MTDYFATSAFISGMGAVIDLGGTRVRLNEASSPNEADYLALANDWAMVGHDMREAIGRVISEIDFGAE